MSGRVTPAKGTSGMEKHLSGHCVRYGRGTLHVAVVGRCSIPPRLLHGGL